MYPAGTLLFPSAVAESVPPAPQMVGFTAVSVPASGLFTLNCAPATSKEAQILPPPCTNKAFTSKPVVTPGTTIPKLSVLS